MERLGSGKNLEILTRLLADAWSGSDSWIERYCMCQQDLVADLALEGTRSTWLGLGGKQAGGGRLRQPPSSLSCHGHATNNNATTSASEISTAPQPKTNPVPSSCLP